MCNPVTQCTGGRSQKLLNRSILFSNPDDANKLLACAGDESSNSVSYRVQLFCAIVVGVSLILQYK